jgi:dienelactone hydrolase
LAPRIASFVFIATFLLAGCSPAPPEPAPSEPATAPQPAPEPPATGSGPVRRVTFVTSDGVTVAGDLYVPEKTPAPAVVALHQWQSSRASYAEFGRRMREAGFVVLAVDGRGYGESTQGASGAVSPSWDTTRDVAAAVRFLTALPEVDAGRIGLVGASYGASNALIYAASDPGNVRAVALLSVGVNYNDSLPTEPAVASYGDRPLLMVAARDDAEAAAAVERLAGLATGPRPEVKVYDAGGHGTALLEPSVGGADLVRDFFARALG